MSRVLVVDSDWITAHALFRGLGGYEVAYARTASEALALAKRKKPDLAVVECLLPDLPGVQLLASLQSLVPRLPVIMIAPYDSEPIRASILKAGARGYFAKPLDAFELRNAIECIFLRGGPVTLTNKHTMAFAWTLRPPPAGWSLTAGRVASVALSMGPVPATNVRLIYSSLIEQSTKVLLGSDQIQICHNAAGPCQTDFSLAAGSANELFVRVRDEFQHSGVYQGAIVIACAQKSEGDSFNLTIYNSAPWRRPIGVLLIVAGVCVTWFLTVYARARTMRDQALMPAVALREKLGALSDSLLRAPAVFAGNFVQTKEAIGRLLGQLDDESLERQGYLPPKLPFPYASTASRAEAYKVFLESLNDPIGTLIILVRDGLPAAWSYWQPGMAAFQEAAIQQAITAIDHLAAPGGPAKPAEAQVQVGNTLRDLRRNLGLEAIAVPPGAPATPSRLTYEGLAIDVERISGLFWVVWALLTSLAGAAILVLAKDGFGVPMDYIYCLFWGLGIPAAGQSLTQLTAGSVTSALGISLVKG